MTSNAHDLYSALFFNIQIRGKLSQVTEGLKACKTDGEIIAFVRRIIDEINSDLINLAGLEGDGKNEAKATQCRKAGNAYFNPNVKQYIKAVKQYNECIALSEEGSENLALAYANRSAVCFVLKEYADCLENIRLARESSYPEHLVSKLNQRESNCLKLLTADEGWQLYQQTEKCEPKLAYEPHSKIPQLSNCIELKKDEQFGRYLMTNRNLNAGDCIIVEKPFATLLDVDLRYTNCDYCLGDNFLTLIPCKSCTITMFCSEECRHKAWESYHRIECSILKDMHFLFRREILCTIRTVMMAISTFDYNLDELRLFIESIDERSLNPLKLDWTAIDSKQVYGTIHMLATNQHLRRIGDIILQSFCAILMSENLFQRTELGQLCDNNESHDLIRQLIFRHLQTAVHTMMFVDYTPMHTEKFPHDKLAYGSFPITSMINHSCAPNVGRVNLPNGDVAVFVQRPIKKGGQLFDDYGYHHYFETLSNRQSGLLDNYFFNCQCEACKLNYPLYKVLPNANLPSNMTYPINCAEMSRIDEQDRTTILRKMPEYCQLINTLDSQYPNREVSLAQGALLKCIGIVYANQSRKIKYSNMSRFD